MKKINLYGAGGHAKVILDILLENNIQLDKIYDGNPECSKFLDYPIERGEIYSPLIISIGNNCARYNIVKILGSQLTYENAISKYSVVSSTSSIKEGTVVVQGAVIQAYSSIGRHVIINTSTSVDHDCIIDDFVHIAPGAHLCGGVSVGEGTLVGAGAVITSGVSIGKWCVINPGAVVTENIADNVII